MDERPDRHAVSDGPVQKSGPRPDGTTRGVWRAVCLEAYEMLEEIALKRDWIPGRQKAAQEAWRRITTFVIEE